jgi:hypothetical protein
VAESPLTDAKRFTENIEHAFREMWTRWCSTKSPQAMRQDRESLMADTCNKKTGFPLPVSCKMYKENLKASDNSSFVVCAMLSPDQRYYKYAERLTSSCEKYRLPYRIYEVPGVHISINLKGTENLAYTKANFIAFAMEQLPGKSILYVDVDFLFVDFPAKMAEASKAEYDFAIYNWLSDRHNEAYLPVRNKKYWENKDGHYYEYVHHIAYYCKEQLMCSGGVQFYNNSPQAKAFLERWQNIISLNPHSADDECLDYVYNNLRMEKINVKALWLDKSYIRMPWWPHIKPVILHPGFPMAADRAPITEASYRKRFYPELCQTKKDDFYFPRDYIIDTKKNLLFKVEDSRIIHSQPVLQKFWIYPEDI